MEQNIEHKKNIEDKLLSFYNTHKLKIYLFISILIIVISSITFLKINSDKKNSIVSEKYVKANLYLSSDRKKLSAVLFEEIIFSKNKFYSILALNAILENNLVNEDKKILNYFEIVGNVNKSKEQNDLIKFKKALYFIKNNNEKEAKFLLNNLIQTNSKLKPLAEEIIAK
jgi:hypothetical protein